MQVRARDGDTRIIIFGKQRPVRFKGSGRVILFHGCGTSFRGRGICPRSHSSFVSTLGLECGLLDSQFSALSNVYCESKPG